MRRYTPSSPEPAANQSTRNDWVTIKTLLPYLWAYKWRVSLALTFLIGAKLANVGVPLVLKKLVDSMTITPAHPQAMLALPLGILIAYGVLRICTTLFTELREFVFAKVTQRAVRTIALKEVRQLHALSLLNSGQATIIAIAVPLILWRATQGVIDGSMTLGDLVLGNAFMIQLYIPLNFLGVIYREIKQSLADMERLFSLLDQHREIADAPDAKPLVTHGAGVKFSHVDFSYEPNRQILFDVDFTIAAGTTTAVVGHSGSGKSTLSRLLFRFYDVQAGTIEIDGQDLRRVTQASLRSAIGIVPQDTVLFNDTIEYNIAYGRPGASHEDIVAAAKAAYIHDFIVTLPDGYATMVGERGLKLSGGEKQRVAIARTLLKAPAILIFDEATSALDSKAEQAIQAQLKEIAKNRTTLVIAHRLSTIADAAQILVLDHGRIIERGTHLQLMAAQGVYAQLWERQQART